MGHNFDFNWMKKIIFPIIIEFAEKYCPSYKLENNDNEMNKINIDFDKKLYNLPDEIKQKIELNDEDDEEYFELKEFNEPNL